jgi:hypothetical protein
MWVPQQLAAQADTLKKLGYEGNPQSLGDPTKPPLAAVVSLGGCSATFVSSDGLIVTNHHCVQGALMHNATPEQNVIETGYLAKTRADEKWAGPTAHVYVTTKLSDVTAQMNEGLAALADDLARFKKLEEREKEIIARCESGRPELRCRVADFYGGTEWTLIEQLDLRDVRLVYAPARSIGNYGGEVDNWMWPRHTGDFAFYRAYASPEQKPADFAANNVPYHPSHHLKVATTGLRDGDMVMVAGYPGVTNRLATAAQTEEAAGFWFPRGLEVMAQQVATIESVTSGRPELQIKAEPMKRGLQNYLKKNQGVLETMSKGGLLERKKAQEAALLAWIDADPARKAKFRPAFDRMASVEEARRKTREQDAAFKELVSASKLFNQAVAIARTAEERKKPDAQRKPAYQERNYSRLEQSSLALEKSYAREIDRAMLKLFVMRAVALPKEQQPAMLAILLPKGRDEQAVEKALDALYAGTKLETGSERAQLIKTGDLAKLKQSKDTFLKLALAALPQIKAAEEQAESYSGAMKVLMPSYVAALKEMRDGAAIAPDANSTLRITYGTVQPSPRGGRAFTTASELVAKHTGEAPFDAPAPLLAAIRERKFGSYLAPELGDLPVNFMSDTDITNGNSGSSTLNARGEVVGLAFDGTLDTVASDWLYLEGVTRTIHVDARYMLWVMEMVDHADELLVELGARK